MTTPPEKTPTPVKPTYQSPSGIGAIIFFSRWLQAPLYIGLIVAQGVYVYRFMMELYQLVIHVVNMGADVPTESSENQVMLAVLGLIDVVMIANLLIMVVIGGYETFVSKLDIDGHPDQPEWLSHVNAGLLKVKLATALIGISSIHLLKSFIEADTLPNKTIMWQVIIHSIFVISALFLAWIDQITFRYNTPAKKEEPPIGH